MGVLDTSLISEWLLVKYFLKAKPKIRCWLNGYSQPKLTCSNCQLRQKNVNVPFPILLRLVWKSKRLLSYWDFLKVTESAIGWSYGIQKKNWQNSWKIPVTVFIFEIVAGKRPTILKMYESFIDVLQTLNRDFTNIFFLKQLLVTVAVNQAGE